MKTTTFFSTLIALALMGGTATIHAQYGLGTNTPNAQAALHIESASHGVLIPNVALTDAAVLFTGVTATADHESMLVYNTSTSTANGLTGEGFYYWADGVGGSWVRLQSGSAGSIAPATIDPGANGQVLTTTGGAVVWETPTVATTSHWNVQGGTTPATLNTQNIYQEGDVAVGTTTNRKSLSVTGALYVNFREHAVNTDIVWLDSDFAITLDDLVDGAVFKMQLPDATQNTGRMIFINNNAGGPVDFHQTADAKFVVENFGFIGGGKGAAFISDGTTWHCVAGY